MQQQHPSYPPYNIYIPDAPMSHLHDDIGDSIPPPSSETMAVWPPALDNTDPDVHYP